MGDGDIDDDGIADSWEQDNFGDLTTADASTDYDNDGILDKDEYANNTLPTIVTPAVISITPSAGTNSIVVTDTQGSNFQNGATVKLTMSGQQDINATDVVVVDVTHITSTFNLAGAAAGMWDVKVTLPNGETGTLQHGFTLTVPAGHWKFDEGIGMNATDSSGNGNNGAINGAIWATGKNGGALSFHGVSDNVQITGLLAQPKDVTISAWAQLSAKDAFGAEVISLGDHVVIRLDGSNGAMGFYYDGTTWRGTATGLSYAGTGWHHFVYVIDDTNNIQKVYIDGVEKGSTAYTQSIVYTGMGYNTFIGRHGNGDGNYDFNGLVDDVRVYNKALSVHEVLELYNQFASPLTTPYASSSMTIDGNLNESDWNITTNVSKTVIGTTNNTTKFGVLWDSTYLYVGMTVLDDNLYNDSAYVWEDDSVEIYIDGDHNHGTTYDNYDPQFVKGWNDPTLFEQHGKTTGVLHGWAPVSGGYSIELAIPWSNLEITPTAGMTIGFNVEYNNDDNGSGRDGHTVWRGTANNWLDTSAFGEIVLEEAPPPTPTPAYTPTSTPIPTPVATLLSTPTPVPLPTAIALPPDLQAFYNFDEGSGASAHDSSGNGQERMGIEF